MEGWKPSIVVGIDFGMTCTAVCWSKEPEWSYPQQIQKWPRPPGGNPAQLDNKVTTAVGYDANDNLANWGFVTGRDGLPVTLEDQFKLYIDPVFPDESPTRPIYEQVLRFYEDYMTSLCRYIESFFQTSTIDFYERNVEFLFSIPTTWKNPTITANLERILANAGFQGYNRRLKIYLTEAEAAAVNAAKEAYSAGDVIMVADAGGATTDINILQVLERSATSTRLRALTKAEGINVGSTLIDESIRQLIRNRLQELGVPGDIRELAWIADDMLREKPFEAIKVTFLGEQYQVQSNNMFTIPVDCAPLIRDRRIVVTGREIKDAFDSQIRVMVEKIEQQTMELLRNHPNSTVNRLMLSGGLGSSMYILNELRARFPGMRVFCVNEPQLAVARGLVMDRVQKLKGGVGIYSGKCSRVSYGVLCRQPYDRTLHRGEVIEIDPLDKRKWATEQIDWLIKEGEHVRETGLDREYQMKLPKGTKNKTFEAQFVMSYWPARDLPQSLIKGNVERLCIVRATFRDDEPFRRVRGFIFGQQSHVVAEFKLKVIVETTGLKFEITSLDGVPFHQNAASVAVEWQEMTAPPDPPPLREPRAFYPRP